MDNVNVGDIVGNVEGYFVGSVVGKLEGSDVGAVDTVGNAVREFVGDDVGEVDTDGEFEGTAVLSGGVHTPQLTGHFRDTNTPEMMLSQYLFLLSSLFNQLHDFAIPFFDTNLYVESSPQHNPQA